MQSDLESQNVGASTSKDTAVPIDPDLFGYFHNRSGDDEFGDLWLPPEREIHVAISDDQQSTTFDKNLSYLPTNDLKNPDEQEETAAPPSPSSHRSILVSLSSRCVGKGTICERPHLFMIKYYGSFDKPLGRFLQDNILHQNFVCHSCEMPSEAHVRCYTHGQGTLTVSVKKLDGIVLPGEGDGDIWMWHRCLRCPRVDGYPPSTRRALMSDAAWGLSFGKFLELSFSDNAASTRLASCGHSLHRDCLRFYGFGQMIACFYYASIDVHSVYLPPAKLDFNYQNQEWIEKQVKVVEGRAEFLFSQVLTALRGFEVSESRPLIKDLQGLLQKEKTLFEERLHNILNKEAKICQPFIDILELNRLRRELVFQSYVWDQRLIHTNSLYSNNNAKMEDYREDESCGDMEGSEKWLKTPFAMEYQSSNKLDAFSGYEPAYISSFQDPDGGARFLLPTGVNDTVIPVYDDEPTSLISYALVSRDHYSGQHNKPKGNPRTLDEMMLEFGEEGMLTSLHPIVCFTDDGKIEYSVTCYYAKRFESVRRRCCPTEMDFIRSLSRCKKWEAQGGSRNLFFAKTLDDRFIIKQVTKTELQSFMRFGPEYFKYVSESIDEASPTCLAKILGIYQVSSKHVKGGKETKMEMLVMENLIFGRNIRRLYDLKGSSRSRYNLNSSGSNKVLLDQNLMEEMPSCPIFVGNKAKRVLERAVWNDTSFLAGIDVMDYSVLVGVDEEKKELVIGMIDYLKQYTWDKQLETWVKASVLGGGNKNVSPTVISPKQYKKRFRKAINTYFLMVPDWVTAYDHHSNE